MSQVILVQKVVKYGWNNEYFLWKKSIWFNFVCVTFESMLRSVMEFWVRFIYNSKNCIVDPMIQLNVVWHEENWKFA